MQLNPKGASTVAVCGLTLDLVTMSAGGNLAENLAARQRLWEADGTSSAGELPADPTWRSPRGFTLFLLIYAAVETALAGIIRHRLPADANATSTGFQWQTTWCWTTTDTQCPPLHPSGPVLGHCRVATQGPHLSAMQCCGQDIGRDDKSEEINRYETGTMTCGGIQWRLMDEESTRSNDDCRKSVSYLAELWEPSSNNIFQCPIAYTKIQRRPLVAANELSTGGYITQSHSRHSANIT
ncbi:hypothetical protein DFH08DRAFT_817756 [Mycena albidolilacea]|uniref:Uncharacterized protein n=1 Tax=Mycena albidolilacea TaxID=1033008 RepID=A0AAD7EH64_9AGAR|nr:hypothetical protein DFH08DRAFT_817756 [Mycena albidolilacea]